MYGITPTPNEIPPEHLPKSTTPKSKRPLLISIIAIYYLILAGVSLFLALVPWGNPDSGLANYLTANPSLVFHSIPRMFRPGLGMHGQTPSDMPQMLPFIFLAVSIFSGLLAFKLWTLSARWRWAIMFWAGYSLCSTLRSLVIYSALRGAVDIPLPPLPAQYKLALVVSMAWNLLVICYLAFYPGVKDAFEGQPY
jgi:hypothetical protein